MSCYTTKEGWLRKRKIDYDTLEAAEQMAAVYHQSAYHCECGKYHLTSLYGQVPTKPFNPPRWKVVPLVPRKAETPRKIKWYQQFWNYVLREIYDPV